MLLLCLEFVDSCHVRKIMETGHPKSSKWATELHGNGPAKIIEMGLVGPLHAIAGLHHERPLPAT